MTALTEAEAFLRVALLVSRADGHESPDEMMATAESLAVRLGSPSLDTVQALHATHEVITTPAREILRRVSRSIQGREARLQAFAIACEVAKADSRLHWDETRQMVEIAKALGIKDADVQRIAAAYWA